MPEPDKSIGRKILGFFIKEEEAGNVAAGSPPTGAPTPAAPRPAAVPSAPTESRTSSPAAPTTGSLDQKFAEHFANVLAQNNPPGPDYFEFRETLRSLNNLGLTEDK